MTNRKIRVGRYTASLLLLVMGGLLLWDKLQNTDVMFRLLKWWPAIFICWGVEYILFFLLHIRRMRAAKTKIRFRPDFKGVFLSLLLSASVFIVIEQSHYAHLWNRVSMNLTASSMEFSEAKGESVDKGDLLIPVEEDTAKLVVESVNGDIELRRGLSDDVEVHTELWADEVSASEAAKIAEESQLTASTGKTMTLTPKGQTYGLSGKRQPRMNLTISLPKSKRLNIEVRTTNGSIVLNRVDAADSLLLETGNGGLTVTDTIGKLTATTLNGNVKAHRVTGDIEMKTNRGNMEVGDIRGNVSLSTMVGNIAVARSLYDIHADTKNGNIGIHGADAALDAQSLNGGISISTAYVGGDWNVYSAVGEIKLELPGTSDFKMDGSIGYGTISTNLPLTIEGKTITGTIGTGEYDISVEGNSDLIVNNSGFTPAVPATTPQILQPAR
ncbi:DUF4097 family beta strand repeat-containing protein [Paenibacillus sp. JX-17]|uniref:DUF4097 family beta strand repeat-containing protein n=1 Tax=Paenibacillus lacisoli TaxID=3064525 RepID=A0ABT9CFZ0_9BACL|nr:DUF4097 family beta strand repeat-containing protein [Paenibacillus sp. JX-17]MDO7907810.1 DUF4097 family beta strand repeat-containing protein [Paenibacillus sp. JX-17]